MSAFPSSWEDVKLLDQLIEGLTRLRGSWPQSVAIERCPLCNTLLQPKLGEIVPRHNRGEGGDFGSE